MQYLFPKDFIFGTSTAATQVETAFEHDWMGVPSKDGYVLDRTTDHELRLKEDAKIIASVAPYYRMGLMWSKLQREPFGDFHAETVSEYRSFLDDLQSRGVKIMMVLHHFTNPLWFSKVNGWEKEENIPMWVDFCKKIVAEFGTYVTHWNTFNEPNLYTTFGWVTGFFPPFKKNIYLAGKVAKNLGLAHVQVYDFIKSTNPNQPIGISHNTAVFWAENALGWLPAKVSDWWFMEHMPSHFEKVDFFGMSYYARLPHDPMPITFMDTPEKMKKLGRPYDDMWEYYPEGLRICIERYWNKYKKPIIITENGVCDESDTLRQTAIIDYAKILHQALQDGIEVQGYFMWSTWDNFEWHLGPTKRFGLYEVNLETMERRKRPSAEIYRKLAYNRMFEVNQSKHALDEMAVAANFI